MPFVQRDGGGAIVGTYFNPQKGYAEEFLQDNDPAVVAYLNPAPDPRIVAMKADTGRVALLAKLRTSTPAQIDSYVAANVTNLTQARDMIGMILKLLALDARI